MADPIQILTHDHREVERLFREFESTGDRGIAMKICTELEVHTTIEEELVYPILARVDTPLEREGEKEHEEADELVRQAKAEHDPAHLRQVMAQLKQAIQHHVGEEESEAFPKLVQQASGELHQIGPTMERRKQELLTQKQTTSVTDAMSSMATGAAGPFSGESVSGQGSASMSSSTASNVSTASKKEKLLDLTKEELMDKARKADISGRSKMKKEELAEALAKQS